MARTHNSAIDLAAAGNWDRAWEVAQLDEGLPSDVTREQWVAFAEKCIARRAEFDHQARYY